MVKSYVSLGEFLKELRKDNNISQEKLANEIGVTRQAYSNYELGRCEPSMEILGKLSIFYKISVEMFFEKGIKAFTSKKLNDVEEQLLSSFGLLDKDNQKEIFELIMYKLSRTLRIFI